MTQFWRKPRKGTGRTAITCPVRTAKFLTARGHRSGALLTGVQIEPSSWVSVSIGERSELYHVTLLHDLLGPRAAVSLRCRRRLCDWDSWGVGALASASIFCWVTCPRDPSWQALPKAGVLPQDGFAKEAQMLTAGAQPGKRHHGTTSQRHYIKL